MVVLPFYLSVMMLSSSSSSSQHVADGFQQQQHQHRPRMLYQTPSLGPHYHFPDRRRRRYYTTTTTNNLALLVNRDDDETKEETLFTNNTIMEEDESTSTSSLSSLSSTMEFATAYHAPVMVHECIDALLDCQRGRTRLIEEDNNSNGNDDDDSDQPPPPPLLFVDGTLGGGGHSAALLERLRPGDIVLGCDVDPTALRTASDRLARFMDHDGTEKPLFVPVECNFGDMASVLPTIVHPISNNLISSSDPATLHDSDSGQAGIGGYVDGILLDFGVSSHQIDEADRGFSFMRDGPLDMRMSGRTTESQKQLGLSAADICNEFDEAELQRIFSKYGDEPKAKTVAKAIVKHRPLTTTGELAEAIGSVTPTFAKNKRNGRTATCARIFQSLRIVVNNEDGVLERVLSVACPTLLRPGGRLVCMSYHSMEDRATKRIMRDGILDKRRQSWGNEKDIYGNDVSPPKPFRPAGKPVKASAEEVERNPRARSAVLRIAERL